MKTFLFEPILNIPEQKIGKWEIKHKLIKAGEEITIVSVRDAIFSGKKSQKAIVDNPIIVHQLYGDGGLWMSDSPQENEGQRDIVEKCKGNVLIGGLGLGYIASMLDRKKNVKSITVVELEKDVISLVWKHLNLKKSEIIHMDLFDYLKSTKKKFNWVYYDIWTPTGEDILYTHIRPLKTLSKGKVPFKHILCWSEATMLGQMMLNLHTTIQIGYDKQLGIVRLSEKEFQDYYHLSRTTWAYYNWFRQMKPDNDFAVIMAKHYVSTYTDYDEWIKIWGKWDKKEVKL